MLVALAACSGAPPASGPVVRELSGPAPALEGDTLDGGRLEAADTAGRVVVVNVWATWCDPCERELPLLVRAHERYGDEVAFVGVDHRDDGEAALEWVERFQIRFPVLADPTGRLGDRLGVPYLPTTVIVDAAGRLRYRVEGELDRATLDRLIAEVSG
jgi:cytochrome c biogenesis protein CcmG/thiol:disulfide interchange protein DsbE